MSELTVIATVDVDKSKAPKDLGVQKLAYTVNPAIVFMGVEFEAQKTLVPLSRDGKKMRICAPVLVPGEIWRNSLGGHTVKFLPEEIELIMLDFMQRYNSQNQYFKHEHKDPNGVGSYILESWLVEDPETDKANTVYNLGLPKGSWVIITQFTDEAEFNKVVQSGATGLSIEGWLGHKMAMSMEQNYADVILINEEGKALLLKRSEADTFEPGKLGFPGGKIEIGEDPKTAALRELIEETGIELQDLEDLGEIENPDGTKSCYFGALYSGNPILSNEHVAFEWLTAEEIGENVILGDTERFKNLIIKAGKMEEPQKVALPDGTYTSEDGKKFQVKGGVIVTPEQMAEDQKKPEEGEAVEMATEELEDGGTLETEGDLIEGAKTTATDGKHVTKSGKVVTVAGGIVEKIEDKPEPGTVKTDADYFTKEEVLKMISDLKEEFAKGLADAMTQAKGTGESSDGGEGVEMSEELPQHERIASRLEMFREQAQ